MNECGFLSPEAHEDIGYDRGFRDGYAQCIADKEERKERNRLFGR